MLTPVKKVENVYQKYMITYWIFCLNYKEILFQWKKLGGQIQIKE